MAIFTDRDFDYVLNAVVQATSDEVLPRFRSLAAADVAQKSSAIDLVTQADLLCEKHIVSALLRRFPQALIVAEESYEADRTVISALREADLAFVIDPVDGTYNFASGSPAFGTILAVVVRGETVAGLIYDCVNGGHIAAKRGAGAYMMREDGSSAKIAVAPPVLIEAMIGAMGWAFMNEPERSRIAANMSKIHMPITINCSAYEYWLASTGRLHFVGHGRATPWDHLAGVLIHQEAGGYSGRFDGSPYRPGDVEGGILCAPDRDSWKIIRRVILALP